MSQVPELSIPELLDQPWTKRAGRIASFVAVLCFGGALSYFMALGVRVERIEQDRATRIVRADNNTAVLNNTIITMKSDIKNVQTDVTTVKIDLAEVKGILKQIRQEQIAASIELPKSQPPVQLLAAQR